MARGFRRNNKGFKQTVQVVLDGVIIDRNFRNRGEAIDYLQRDEDLTREEINRRVRFNTVNPDEEEYDD